MNRLVNSRRREASNFFRSALAPTAHSQVVWLQVSGLKHSSPLAQFPSLFPLLSPQLLPLASLHGTTVQVLALAKLHLPMLPAAGSVHAEPSLQRRLEVHTFPLAQTPTTVLGGFL